LTEQKTRNCIREVLKALDYLHRRNVAHLDLKPQNILLNSNNLEGEENRNMRRRSLDCELTSFLPSADGLKLCDFGFSRAIESGNSVCEIQGTPDYVAPEIIQYEPLSLKTDVWSVGVLTYVLLSGCSPFGSDDKQETFLNITQCNLTFPEELFEDVSDDAIDFMKCTMRLKSW
jgi:serine/threonine kinase 17